MEIIVMSSSIHPDALKSLVEGTHGAAFDVLGPHTADGGQVIIRTLQPRASEVSVVIESTGVWASMTRTHDGGVWEVSVPGGDAGLRYHLAVKDYYGETVTVQDPYRFGAQLTDFDRYLLAEGRHLYSYEKLGAHPKEIDGIAGVQFAVWAPNARRVSVIGGFNGWNTALHPMRNTGGSGFWEIFIPGAKAGDIYRYDVLAFNGYHMEKADPYGFRSEVRPANASIVADLDYQWGDGEWMTAREKRNPLNAPMSIYEVHLGSWRRNEDGGWLNYRQLAHELVGYCKEMGFTHIELMPVLEHALDASWGYQVTGYFAATSRYGSPQDFMYFVDQCHQHGIGVILDWVPAHFPKDGHALSYFDGTHLYEHADPRQGEHPDWGTYIFNFGRNEVRNFLLSNALFWLKVYHIDGLRVDAVSSMLYLDFSRKHGQWVPNKYGGNENLEAISFLREFNETVHGECPGTYTIAEESTAWAMVSRPVYIGGLGFSFKWNMGWMHDTLDYAAKDPVYRRYHHNKMTFSLLYAFNENFILSLSHDEVVHMKGSLIQKMAGDWQMKFAGLRLLLGYQMTHPGKKLNFMGAEFGQWREWSETRALDWDLLKWTTHLGVQSWMRDLNAVYQKEPALWEIDYSFEGFQWIDANDADNSVYSYIRFADDASDFLVVACNFTPIKREGYRLGVPEGGFYSELLNSDSTFYGGGNLGNGGGLMAEMTPAHGMPASLSVTLPPMSIVIFKPGRPPGGMRRSVEKARLAAEAATSAAEAARAAEAAMLVAAATATPPPTPMTEVPKIAPRDLAVAAPHDLAKAPPHEVVVPAPRAISNPPSAAKATQPATPKLKSKPAMPKPVTPQQMATAVSKPRTPQRTASAGKGADDLKQVEGIGPKIAAALVKAGIASFEKLAKTSEADLKQALEQDGLRFAPSIGTWAEQAALLAKGDTAGLKQLQDKLTGGRRVE
jgi:1,4-alpha-glucan branching enzyme